MILMNTGFDFSYKYGDVSWAYYRIFLPQSTQRNQRKGRDMNDSHEYRI